jgi:hypothetical protein
VLGGDQHPLDLDRDVVAVADRDLGLGVGAEVGKRAVLAHRREPLGEAVGERDRERHQLVGLGRGVAEHHALVARAGLVGVVVGALLAGLLGGVDALGDVGRLLVHALQHLDRVGAEIGVEAVVADLADRLAGDLGEVEVRLGADLAGDHHQVGVDERLAGDPGLLALTVGHHGVEDAVGDLVANLVGMTLGYGLGREEVLALGERLGIWHGGKPR